MSIILFLLATLALAILGYIYQKKRKPSKTLIPPGPPGFPFIGNLHQLATVSSPHIYLWKLSKKYGSIMQMKLGSIPLLVISSPRLAKEVLKTHDLSFCSRPNSLGTRKLSYDNSDIVFSPYNDYWREVRKITTLHLLSLKKIQSFRLIREEEVFRMVARIVPEQTVNLGEVSMVFSSNLICQTAFGKRYDDEGSELKKFKWLLHEVQALGSAFFVSDYFPSFGWIDKVCGLINRLDKTCGKLDSFYQELIDEHLQKKSTVVDREDILDILIRIREQNSSSVDFTWDNVKALLMNIFIAATDASATTIVWTLTALMKSPKIMKKAQSEIRNFVGTRGKVDEDDMQNLPYLKAIVSETLRLYPPAPLLVPRETIEKCNLEGFEIQPKTLVYVNAWAIARDPDYWENPHEFLPERFLNSDHDVKGQDFGVIPFGSGRRICPGMFMGLANVELAVANLLYAFDWVLPSGIKPEDIDTDVLPGVSVHKKNPLYLVPRKYI